ncbi:MAG: hypothetical protein K9J13_10315 [Saprospiraceae bacterium]|nr:hypothetical protein [Saprospiraceae bacterium]
MINKSKYFFGFLFLFLLTIATTEISAQTRISSPYSRFGIGNISNNSNARNLAMGGITYGLQSNSYINFSNPASYVGFDSMSFVFEGGIKSDFVKLETNKNSQNSSYASLGYLNFGFPVTKWWGSSFGLMPYSNVGYKISTYDYLQDIGNVNFNYSGEGGINQVYWGNAFELIDSTLSIGINASYLFGYLDRIRTAVFIDSTHYLDTKITDSRLVNDVLLSYGIQYRKKFKKDWFLESGLTFNLASKISATKNSLSERFQYTTSGLEIIHDTVENITGIGGDISIPLSLGAGIVVRKGNNWLFGFDYSWQNWSDYSSFGEVDSLANSMGAAFGAEFTPTNTNMSKYWSKVNYRIGARYNKTYLQIKNNQLEEYAISFGLGLPVLKSKSTLNIGVELGKRGTTGTIDNPLILENFTRITFGVAIKERWFHVRKYE